MRGSGGIGFIRDVRSSKLSKQRQASDEVMASARPRAGAVSFGRGHHRPLSGYVAGHKYSRTIVASLLDWANAAFKNKISRESSMPRPDEKQGSQRQQVLKAGTISFDGSGIDCLVRKMSGEGANLEVESQIGIPNSFDLVIDTEHSNHHCHIVWRKARRIGIAFD